MRVVANATSTSQQRSSSKSPLSNRRCVRRTSLGLIGQRRRGARFREALLRRSRPERIAERLYAGDLDLDRETRRVRRGVRDIHLGPTEFRLLEYLLEKPGRVFSRAQLLDGVWGQAAEIDERTVDVHVGRLRKALSRGRERDPIRTVRGTGYAFDETFGK